jgi:hypothetical protein
MVQVWGGALEREQGGSRWTRIAKWVDVMVGLLSVFS